MKHSTGVTYMGINKPTCYQRYKVFIDYVKFLATNTDKKIGIISSTNVRSLSGGV